MSRIGKLPVEIPSGVNATIAGDSVKIEGPKGKLEHKLVPGITVAQEENNLVVKSEGKSKQARANYGTTRALINNMVIGVAEGWKRSLELSGVGYTAKLAGDVLTLTVGFSHEVTFKVPSDVKIQVGKNNIDMESPSKEQVGSFAAKIRAVHPPEPYLGKGIKYSDEIVRRKAGKAK